MTPFDLTLVSVSLFSVPQQPFRRFKASHAALISTSRQILYRTIMSPKILAIFLAFALLVLYVVERISHVLTVWGIAAWIIFFSFLRKCCVLCKENVSFQKLWGKFFEFLLYSYFLVNVNFKILIIELYVFIISSIYL